MAPTQPRHDDIIIRRRFGEHASTHAVKQLYAVTYPGHTDHGAERENYDEAAMLLSTSPKHNGSPSGTKTVLRAGGERS